MCVSGFRCLLTRRTLRVCSICVCFFCANSNWLCFVVIFDNLTIIDLEHSLMNWFYSVIRLFSILIDSISGLFHGEYKLNQIARIIHMMASLLHFFFSFFHFVLFCFAKEGYEIAAHIRSFTHILFWSLFICHGCGWFPNARPFSFRLMYQCKLSKCAYAVQQYGKCTWFIIIMEFIFVSAQIPVGLLHAII